jgi:hypothetical protein
VNKSLANGPAKAKAMPANDWQRPPAPRSPLVAS